MAGEDTLKLTQELIRRESVTPHDAGCQALLAERLADVGFETEHLRFGDPSNPTDNLWARHGSDAPVLCFAGHTDVVPPGPISDWDSPPFDPVIRDDHLFGRGAADMKASIAAMTIACASFVANNPDHRGSIALLITSDEEGPADDGTVKVMETLAARDEKIDWCIVGEPSSRDQLGDLIRIGRRGSLSGILEVNGVQGHVAYQHLADNPIRRFAPVLDALYKMPLDDGNEHFPPTTFEFVNIEAGTGAPNVTPGRLKARFNFRYSTEWTAETLITKVESLLDSFDIDYDLRWRRSGSPFLTMPGTLTDAVTGAIKCHTGLEPELSTGGGTSDGRFIAPHGVDVVELGPVNASIHKVNERVRVEDIRRLRDIYLDIIKDLLK